MLQALKLLIWNQNVYKNDPEFHQEPWTMRIWMKENERETNSCTTPIIVAWTSFGSLDPLSPE